VKSLAKLTWMEGKLFLREPIGAFFTLVFPLMMLFLFGSIYGNDPSPYFGGYGSMDVSVPAYIAMIIGIGGLMSISITMASYRELGILRRLRTTPVRPQMIRAAQLIVVFVMTVIGIAFLVAGAKIVYGLRFAGNPLRVLAAFILSCLSFFALGFVLAGLLPTARTAQIVGMAAFYPMMFLCGASIPREVLPAGVRQAARFLPLTYVVNLLRGLWVGDAWSAHVLDVAVLAGMLIVGVVLSALTFRWE